MSALIVALSTADVTVRAAAVAFLALVAVVLVSGRFDAQNWRRHSGRTAPVYLRVDQRPGHLYRQPDARRRVAAGGSLTGLAVFGGLVVALVASIIAVFVVESVTNLLR